MINTNPVSAARPLTAADDAPRMTSSLAHAVLVSGELEQRMGQTLRDVSKEGANVNAAGLLTLQLQTAEFSAWTEMVSESIPSYYTPLKEAAGKMG